MYTIEINTKEEAQSIANGLGTAIAMTAEFLTECDIEDAKEIADTLVWMKQIEADLETQFAVCTGM